jgi:hypothetical protein
LALVWSNAEMLARNSVLADDWELAENLASETDCIAP